MTHHSLEDKLQAAGNAVEMARNSQIGPYVYPAVPSEFSNWMDEQVAWRETSALFDQSHHMTDLRVEGPDVITLLSALGVNSFENFAVNKAKQFVACNHDGYVIGDGILFFMDENSVRLVGRPSAHNWVQYHAETGDYDVTVSRDERTAVNPSGGRELYRFQVQGPTAMDVLTQATGGPLPEIKFFNMGEITIAGKAVRALHHGMSGVPGLELFGPWAEREDVRAAIVEAGKDYGLRQVGSRVYATNTLESGWIPCPLPAIFTGDELKAYREWLPGRGLRGHRLARRQLLRRRHLRLLRDAARARLLAVREVRPRLRRARGARGDGGRADAAEGDAGVERRGRRQRDGRAVREGRRREVHQPAALELRHLAARQAARTTASSSVSRPSRATATTSARCCRSATSTSTCRSAPSVTLVWGEEGGGSSKPVVERHAQAEIRAIVSPCPYSEVARTSYAEGWRTKAGVS